MEVSWAGCITEKLNELFYPFVMLQTQSSCSEADWIIWCSSPNLIANISHLLSDSKNQDHNTSGKSTMQLSCSTQNVSSHICILPYLYLLTLHSECLFMYGPLPCSHNWRQKAKTQLINQYSRSQKKMKHRSHNVAELVLFAKL